MKDRAADERQVDPADDLVEALAEIEHAQWLHWSQAVAAEVPADTRAKWRRSWVKYAQLSEDLKEADRVWARKVVALLRQRNLIPGTRKALILVDLQNDFLPGGALAVPDGDQVIPVANQLQAAFPLVVATQDWHPANHGSFAASHPGKKVFEQIELNGLPQTLWPVHCVQNTKGAELAAALNRERIARVFPKGTDAGIDSYSGFSDNGHRQSTGLGEWLKAQGVTEVFVCGLATDYCVKFTALDAARMGFKTHLIEDASRGVNLRPDDVTNAIQEMKRAGVTVVRSCELVSDQAEHETPLNEVHDWLKAKAKAGALINPNVCPGFYFIGRN